MFCYDFALKMTKIMINCSHVPARWVEGMLIRGKCWKMAQFEVYFDMIFPSENSRNLHSLHKK